MGLGRRKVEVSDPRAWVFNRMADAYDARPPYPDALLDSLVALAPTRPTRAQRATQVVDLGAGIGHVALPLAARGLAVTAVEPAVEMLRRLRDGAEAQGLNIATLHAKAEAVPLEAGSCDLCVIADALHFLDAELTGKEVARLLAPDAVLALITCEFANTPFMASLTELMNEAAPRRPRRLAGSVAQLAAVAGIELTIPRVFEDHTPLDPASLDRLLDTISFIGPAMNPARARAFRLRVRALPDPSWARRFSLSAGRGR